MTAAVRAMTADRALDVLVAAAGLALALPALALAAISILATSPGPIFYRAERVGQHGRIFIMYKLRTMHHTVAERAPITAHDDPRVFPVGAWLRAAKVDELPQLWNVLRGQMALVGPRPEDPRIVAAHYGAAERVVLSVRPGLTSPGTLHYYASLETTIAAADPVGSYLGVMRAKLAIDAAYLRRASFAGDLRVLGRTIALIARRAGRDVRSACAGGRRLGGEPAADPGLPGEPPNRGANT